MINSSSRSNAACSANLCLACDHCPRQDNGIHTYTHASIYVGSRRVKNSYSIIHVLLENTLAQQLFNSRQLYSVIDTKRLFKRTGNRSNLTSLCPRYTDEIREIVFAHRITRQSM